jgi:3-oxoacyl-[acyl-carrier protein] reductase
MSTLLITGASRGVGRALALACARSGQYSKIILNGGSDAAALEETSRLVSSAGDLLCVSSLGDVGSLPYVESLRRQFGPVDVLVNNAAVSWVGLLTDMRPEEWDALLRTNLTSLYNTCHTFVPDMVSAGHGKILNISSVWGISGASCEVAYSASKGAVNSFTRALARELAPSHIQVNALALGIVDTRMNAHLSPEEKAEIVSQIPAGYIASPEEAAEAALRLLAMPEYVSGEVVRADGCWT